MTNLIALYRIAEANGIKIKNFDLEGDEAVSFKRKGDYIIIIDSKDVKSTAEEKVKLGHELGHCLTESFYTDSSPKYVKQKRENQANKWAIQHLISLEELNEAVQQGHTEMWDLAEYFNVDEDFMRMAVCWYLYGTLETDNYFAS